MTIAPEVLAAFADGELTGTEAAHIAAAVAADPALLAQVSAHRALKVRLAKHFAPIIDEQLPSRLKPPEPTARAEVIDFSAALSARRQANTAGASSLPDRRGFGWPWLGAMAAALVLAVIVGGWPSEGGLTRQQIAALQTQSSGPVSDNGVGILLSFVDNQRRMCRAYSQGADTGIACYDDSGWRRVWSGEQSPTKGGEMRQAGSDNVILFQTAQEMMEVSLDADQERAAIARGWRP